MYSGQKILGLIPARGGSEAIPRKNIYPINGKPLLMYTIEAAKKSQFLDALYCSTNDDEIAEVVSREAGICQIIRRPDELSTSTARTIESVIHALDFLSSEGKSFDYVMILQPTSPLRQSTEIDGCIRFVIDKKLSSCVSVSQIHCLPTLLRNRDKESGRLSSIVSGNGTVRRQDVQPTYYVDGCLYMWSVAEIKKHGLDISLNDAAFGYEIDKVSGFDLNYLSDIPELEYLLRQRQRLK